MRRGRCLRLKQSITCIYSQGGAYKQQQYYQHFPDPPDMSVTVYSPSICIYLVQRDFTPRKHAGNHFIIAFKIVFAFFRMTDDKVNNPVVLIQTEEMNKIDVALKMERG